MLADPSYLSATFTRTNSILLKMISASNWRAQMEGSRFRSSRPVYEKKNNLQME